MQCTGVLSPHFFRGAAAARRWQAALVQVFVTRFVMGAGAIGGACESCAAARRPAARFWWVSPGRHMVARLAARRYPSQVWASCFRRESAWMVFLCICESSEPGSEARGARNREFRGCKTVSRTTPLGSGPAGRSRASAPPALTSPWCITNSERLTRRHQRRGGFRLGRSTPVLSFRPPRSCFTHLISKKTVGRARRDTPPHRPPDTQSAAQAHCTKAHAGRAGAYGNVIQARETRRGTSPPLPEQLATTRQLPPPPPTCCPPAPMLSARQNWAQILGTNTGHPTLHPASLPACQPARKACLHARPACLHPTIPPRPAARTMARSHDVSHRLDRNEAAYEAAYESACKLGARCAAHKLGATPNNVLLPTMGRAPPRPDSSDTTTSRRSPGTLQALTAWRLSRHYHKLHSLVLIVPRTVRGTSRRGTNVAALPISAQATHPKHEDNHNAALQQRDRRATVVHQHGEAAAAAGQQWCDACSRNFCRECFGRHPQECSRSAEGSAIERDFFLDCQEASRDSDDSKVGTAENKAYS